MLNTFDWTRLPLPLMIASVSAFAAFESLEQTRISASRALWTWLAGAALGTGIWSAHAASMLSWHLGSRRVYSVGETVLSLALAVAASWAAMRAAGYKAFGSSISSLTAAVFLSLGVGTVHFVGIAALHLTPLRWILPWLAASLTITSLLAYAATHLLLLGSGEISGLSRQVSTALILGLAVSAMHYFGMKALLLEAGTRSLETSPAFGGPMLARLGISSVFLFTFGLLVLSHREKAHWAQIAHEARLQAQESCRQAERLAAAGRIAASIAHEINNPLEAVVDLLYLLETAQLGERARGYLFQAQNEIDRVAEITTQSLKFYRQQSAPAVNAIPDLFETALTLFQTQLQKAGIRVETMWTPEIAPMLCCAGEIRQVLANLVGNAIDAMPKGGCLKLELRATAAELEIEVQDTGRGISTDLQEEIFKPFYTTKGLGCTGLGLSISAEIVEKHGGAHQVIELLRARPVRNALPSRAALHTQAFADGAGAFWMYRNTAPHGEQRLCPTALRDLECSLWNEAKL